jgi:hypothetical protein
MPGAISLRRKRDGLLVALIRENAAYDTEPLGGGGFAYTDVTELVIKK